MAEKKDFLAFYRAHVERIYKFVYFRVGSNKETAEDLVQDIFLKAYEAHDRYDPEKSLSAWIFTIARNTVINHYAKRKADVTLEEIESAPIVSADARYLQPTPHRPAAETPTSPSAS
jgi:RNA polymerase sigma-70 factor (ECF subfamily)